MTDFTGVLRKSSFGGPSWTLECEDGERYQVAGGDPDTYDDGTRVVITGQVDRESMSLAMVGPVLRAKSIREA